MRISALMGLMILSVMAGCGSDKDDDKDNDKDDDSSSISEDEVFDAGTLKPVKGDNLDECDKGDPCCINSDQFDFGRCMDKPDGGTTAE